jgi:hypothetical protein
MQLTIFKGGVLFRRFSARLKRVWKKFWGDGAVSKWVGAKVD